MPSFVTKQSAFFSLLRLSIVVAVGLANFAHLLAAEATAEQKTFFETKIQPILVNHCYDCHSAQAANMKKLKAGLRVDSRSGLLTGGESGPAIVPGKPAKSLLISALKHEDWQMPPKGKLPNEVIADFVTWVEGGAIDPRPDSKAALPQSEEKPAATPARSSHWAFQPWDASLQPPPSAGTWGRTAVDDFIFARLQREQLTPAPEAERITLLRRLHFDLIGLPPTPEEATAFLADDAPDAYEKLVDRLHASPHYGERWGRHWLDLARYADSSGFHNDLDRPTAWKYRDYVIRSLNADKPYARFVAEQLAGDEIEGSSEETVIATGFCRNGPSNDDNMGNDKEKYRLDQLDDVISTTASVFLGLTLGCARCHDHKYDPLPTEDYYRFLAIFNSTVKHGGVEHVKENQKTTDAKTVPLALIETSAKARPTFVLRRGNIKTPGMQVEPGVPALFAAAAVTFEPPPADAKSTGRRRTLAAWITSPENALAYRVLANRQWQHFFGRGIVETTSNFGVSGAQPTHPELLDYLGQESARRNGEWKSLQRLLVASAAYRQASRAVDPPTGTKAAEIDPENRLLWRQNIRRLEAEAVRDSVLAVSGNLNTTLFGPGIKPRMRADLIDASQRNKWPALKTENSSHWRRSVYIYIKRQLLMPMLELFDAPTTTDSCAVRPASLVPTQALIMMNDEFIEDQAAYLARRAGSQSSEALLQVIVQAHTLALLRPLKTERLERALHFVIKQQQTYEEEGLSAANARHRAFTDLCHVLLNSSEFMFVE